MKKYILIIAILTCNLIISQKTEERNLENFSKLNVDGRAEIHLIKSHKPSIKIEIKEKYNFKDYISEVRNDELFLYYDKYHENKNENDPLVVVYLYHTGLTNMDFDGLIKLFSESELNQSNLSIKGDGFIKGKIIVDVNNLQIDLDGFAKMTVSGKANSADFSIDGFGKIDAKDLETKTVSKDSDGFTKIKSSS